MRTLVESLRRLYLAGRLTLEQIQERLTRGTITQAEYNYIVGFTETEE